MCVCQKNIPRVCKFVQGNMKQITTRVRCGDVTHQKRMDVCECQHTLLPTVRGNIRRKKQTQAHRKSGPPAPPSTVAWRPSLRRAFATTDGEAPRTIPIPPFGSGKEISSFAFSLGRRNAEGISRFREIFIEEKTSTIRIRFFN